MAENINSGIFVVDSSFVLAFLLPDESYSFSDMIFHRFAKKEISLIAPSLLVWEVLNALRAATKQKRIERKQAWELATGFLDLGIEIATINPKLVFSLAEEKKLTIYDACYLALSMEKNVSLLSLDTDLQKHAGFPSYPYGREFSEKEIKEWGEEDKI